MLSVWQMNKSLSEESFAWAGWGAQHITAYLMKSFTQTVLIRPDRCVNHSRTSSLNHMGVIIITTTLALNRSEAVCVQLDNISVLEFDCQFINRV